MSEPEENTCPFCEKKGLAILPLRVAVGRTETRTGSLDLPDRFRQGAIADTELPANSAQYTSRLLRPGYLYVFNEGRGEWKGYVVTARGFLYEFEVDPEGEATPPDADKIEFSCYRTGEEYIARCITIPFPNDEKAGKVWLGFSDTAWTSDVLKKHSTQTYRERHMQVVNVKEWVSGNTSQDGTAELAQLKSVVNEFTKVGKDYGAPPKNWVLNTLAEVNLYAYPAFSFSPYEFEGTEHEADGLLEWGEKADYPPMMAAVPDPVGVTSELASLLGAKHQEFLEQEALQRPMAVSAVIDSLRESIRNNAEQELIRSKKSKAEWRANPVNYPYYISARDGRNTIENHHRKRLKNDPVYRTQWETKLEAAKQEAVDELTVDDLAEAATDAWEEYAEHLKDGAIEKWKKETLEPQRDAYDKKYILPLAYTHKAWFGSSQCAEHFQCNHDVQDADSGAGYVQSLLLCIQNTQQNKVCADNYKNLLEGDITDHANLILRGLIHDQDEVASAISAAESAGVNLSKIPWTSLIKTYKKSLIHLDEGGKNLVAQLITALGGSIVKVLNAGVDQTAGRLLVKLGVIAESSVQKLSHVGTLDEALDSFVVWMKQANPGVLDDVDASLIKHHLEIQSRGKRANTRTRGADGQFNAGKTEIRLNRFALNQVEEALSQADVAEQVAGITLSMDEMPKNGMRRFKTMFDTKSRLAVVGLLLDVVGIISLSKELDEKTTVANRLAENKWQFTSATMSAIGGVGEWVHDGIMAGAKAGSKRLAPMAGKTWVTWLGRTGKGLGIAGAIIVTTLDGYHAWNQWNEGNIGMASLYAVSVTVNLGAIVLFTEGGAALLGLSAAMATGIGIILIIIGIGIALAINYFHTNELEEWLARCLFGEDTDEQYGNLEVEMKQFELAIESMGGDTGDD